MPIHRSSSLSPRPRIYDIGLHDRHPQSVRRSGTGAGGAAQNGVWEARPVIVIDETGSGFSLPSVRARLAEIVLDPRGLSNRNGRGVHQTRDSSVWIEMGELVPQPAAPAPSGSVNPATVFEEPAAPYGAEAFPIPIGDADAPKKPGFFNYCLNQEQRAKTEDVRRRLLHEALSTLREDDANRPIGSLVERVVARLLENAGAERLSKAYDGLQKQLETLAQDYEDFLDLRIKQKQSSCPALCDARTLFFGDTLTALFLRSALQSALLALSGSAVQYFTYLILDRIARNSPDVIPQEIIDRIAGTGEKPEESAGLSRRQVEELLALMPRDELAALANMSEHDIEAVATQIGNAAANAHATLSDLTPEQLEQARFEFAKPASSILDERSSSKALIYGSEIAHAFGTGSAIAISSNLLRQKFQTRGLGESLAFKREAPSTLERVGTAVKQSAIGQTATGLVSFTIGSLANITGKSISGAPIKDIFKDAGAMALFQLLNSTTNVSMDALLTALLPSEKYGEYCRQTVSVSLRTVCSVASQYLKTEIFRRFNDRSSLGIGDHVRALMTGGVGGLGRETINAGLALLASNQAPADLRYSRSAATTVDSFAEFLRALNDPKLSEALSGTSLEEERGALFNRLTGLVRSLQEAERLKPYSPGIKQQWEQFDQYLNDVIWRRRGPGPHNV